MTRVGNLALCAVVIVLVGGKAASGDNRWVRLITGDYLDTTTISWHGPDTVDFWIKWDNSSYPDPAVAGINIMRDRVVRGRRCINLSGALYKSSGEVIPLLHAGSWSDIVPESKSEVCYRIFFNHRLLQYAIEDYWFYVPGMDGWLDTVDISWHGPDTVDYWHRWDNSSDTNHGGAGIYVFKNRMTRGGKNRTLSVFVYRPSREVARLGEGDWSDISLQDYCYNILFVSNHTFVRRWSAYQK
jgi:hypothetical protein